jgi:two-component system, chemotaxis family, chemotaxis protein CheY
MARILVVDDDRNMRELLGIHLRNAGYEVETAEDGLAGGYGALRTRPDLIISDVNMPHLDGYQFIAALRSDGALKGIPVIFLTSEDDAQFRGKHLGAVGFIAKPVRADRLLSVVAEHVPGGSHPVG